jgi:hypothetical protein
VALLVTAVVMAVALKGVRAVVLVVMLTTTAVNLLHHAVMRLHPVVAMPLRLVAILPPVVMRHVAPALAHHAQRLVVQALKCLCLVMQQNAVLPSRCGNATL